MDDFNVSSLHESKNEWGSRLVTILTPHIMEGLKSIFEEAVKICKENSENDKYLMTFQNFIARIPKWNPVIIEKERIRIVEKSSCLYLEDLITCVHIIQLKILTAIRVGQKQKKIDINIPKIDDFIHKIYIHSARKVYKNVYLFELNIPPLQVQKNYRELEIIVQECILNTVRDSIPVEAILKAYMDETIEDDVVEEVKEQIIEQPQQKKITETQIVKEEIDKKETSSEPLRLESEPLTENVVVKTETFEFPGLKKDDSHLTFNNVDFAMDSNNNEEQISAPKDFDRLEAISNERNAQRKLAEQMDEDEEQDNVKLKIFGESADLNGLDIHVIDEPQINLNENYLLDDIEILE